MLTRYLVLFAFGFSIAVISITTLSGCMDHSIQPTITLTTNPSVPAEKDGDVVDLVVHKRSFPDGTPVNADVLIAAKYKYAIPSHEGFCGVLAHSAAEFGQDSMLVNNHKLRPNLFGVYVKDSTIEPYQSLTIKLFGGTTDPFTARYDPPLPLNIYNHANYDTVSRSQDLVIRYDNPIKGSTQDNIGVLVTDDTKPGFFDGYRAVQVKSTGTITIPAESLDDYLPGKKIIIHLVRWNTNEREFDSKKVLYYREMSQQIFFHLKE